MKKIIDKFWKGKVIIILEVHNSLGITRHQRGGQISKINPYRHRTYIGDF